MSGLFGKSCQVRFQQVILVQVVLFLQVVLRVPLHCSIWGSVALAFSFGASYVLVQFVLCIVRLVVQAVLELSVLVQVKVTL